ncbi:MAG: porphobilinogen synthase [candidate division KSB1 bacterium]|nr:porphobilinogen synthase [candidate division KSB1 bacterium]
MFTPNIRPRRLRRTPTLREMVRETAVQASDFIYPLFIKHGRNERLPIRSLPGIAQLSIDEALKEAKEAHRVGVPSLILFGIPKTKDSVGSESYADDGIVQQAIRALKDAVPEMVVIADVCFCEYTDHGHCGVMRGHTLDNDATLELLQKQVLAQAKAGVDMVAPSGMIDGMVGAIREALDGNGFQHIPILSYAVKYASSFYGPFREAAESAPKFGDRRSHQMDPANVREALRESRLDVEEGADMLMVKPALAFLDVIRTVKERFDLPLAAYNVSGEYAMVKAAAQNGWIDEQRVTMEILTSIKRAGADVILTYHALEAARWLKA